MRYLVAKVILSVHLPVSQSGGYDAEGLVLGFSGSWCAHGALVPHRAATLSDGFQPNFLSIFLSSVSWDEPDKDDEGT